MTHGRDRHPRKRGVIFFCPAQLLRATRLPAGPIPLELGNLFSTEGPLPFRQPAER